VASSSRAWLGCIATYNLYIYVGRFDIDHVCQKPKGAFGRAIACCMSMLYHSSGGFTSAVSALTWRNFQACCSVPLTSHKIHLKTRAVCECCVCVYDSL
jgi:hypothetical protein